MKPHRILLPALLTVCLTSCAVAADRVATFSELPKGDELRVALKSSGCFHYVTYELTFRRSAGLRVRVDDIGPESRFPSLSGVGLGEVTLTRADVEGLDNLLRFYRSKPRMGCTTVETISISQLHRGKVVATENFTDGSCSYDRTDLMMLTTLIERVVQKH